MKSRLQTFAQYFHLSEKGSKNSVQTDFLFHFLFTIQFLY